MARNDLKTAYSFGVIMIIGLIAALFLGMKLDELLGTTPLFIILFIAYIMITAFIKLYHSVTKTDKDG